MLILRVKEILNDDTLMAEVVNEATIGSRKNCNLPGAIIDLPAVSEKDRGDLLFGVEQKVGHSITSNVVVIIFLVTRLGKFRVLLFS